MDGRKVRTDGVRLEVCLNSRRKAGPGRRCGRRPGAVAGFRLRPAGRPGL